MSHILEFNGKTLEFDGKVLEAVRREQILTLAMKMMAKTISTWEPGTWAEIENEYYKKAEEALK